MKHACLCLTIIVCLHVPQISTECHIVQTVKDVANYRCATIRDLRDEGSADITDVLIYNDESLPWINSTTFQKAPNLVYLQIKNSISGIKPDAFVLLRDVDRIVISNNGYFETVTNGTFRNIPVEYIGLDNNKISTIEPGAFSNLPNLKRLRVGGNNLRKIKSGVFNGLPVETLSFSKNRISAIEKNAFMDMEGLKRLHLDGNLLSEFQPEVLMNHGQALEILWLQNNSFTKIDQFTVKGLNNLKLLNLQDNQISEILLYTFYDLQNLEVLVLSNNSLVSVNADIFPKNGMPNLQKLYLDNNRLSFLTTKVLGKLTYLKHIRIGGNPWQCLCLDAIQTWVGDHEIQQNCDKEYYDGSRPVCVITDNSPSACLYDNDLQYYHKYRSAIDSLPASRPCAL